MHYWILTMDINKTISLLSLVAACYSYAGSEDALLRQSWKLDPGVRLLPLTQIELECNGGALQSLRLTADILNLRRKEVTSDGSYLVYGGECTVNTTKKLLKDLEGKVESCYEDDDCESVDLVQGFYMQLVALECSLCTSSQCAMSTPELLLAAFTYTLQVGCRVSGKKGQLLTLHNLSSTGRSLITRREFPMANCNDELEVQRVFLSNQLPKSLIPSGEEEEQIESLFSKISQCLVDNTCEEVEIVTAGVTSDDGQVQPDHVLGVYWMCPDKGVSPTSGLALTLREQRYKAALIVVSILFVLTLAALIGVIVYCHKKVQSEKAGYNMSREKRSETLPKYERSVENLTDEHRYTNLSLKSTAVEGLYEYMDMEPEEAGAQKSAGGHSGAGGYKGATSNVDADGYLVPNP